MTRMHSLQLTILSCLVTLSACGDDGEPQATESMATSDASSTASTTTPDPDSGGSTVASASTTMIDASEGTTSTTAATLDGATETVGETTTGTTGGEDGVLENTPMPCAEDDFIFPLLPREAGHWAATTLTPTVYPFEVQSVVYELTGGAAGGQCNNSFAHTVAIFASDQPRPDDAPSVNAAGYVAYPIDADPAATDGRVIEIVLDAPLVLEDGQSVVVAVQLTAEGDSSLCIRACRDTGGLPELDWWSNAADEPFSWADMVADFGFPENFTVQAFGAVQ